ncbi:MAG: hypothetical protein HYU36_05785 [Planctomycetes bacterium]|nr:hypothetical protein [Planctomycetota bacterium]
MRFADWKSERRRAFEKWWAPGFMAFALVLLSPDASGGEVWSGRECQEIVYDAVDLRPPVPGSHDPESRAGFVRVIPAGRKGNCFQPLALPWEPGQWEITFRIKVRSPEKEGLCLDFLLAGESFRMVGETEWKSEDLRSFSRADPDPPGQYHRFRLELAKPDTRHITLAVRSRGTAELRMDTLRFRRVAAWSDQFLEEKGLSGRTYAPQGRARRKLIFEVRGDFWETYRVQQAVETLSDVLFRASTARLPGEPPHPTDVSQVVPARSARPDQPGLSDEPARSAADPEKQDTELAREFAALESAEELTRAAVLILSNVGVRTHLSYERRYWIREFVRQGGGLLVLGGMSTLERGAFASTFLEELLPLRDIDQLRLKKVGIGPGVGLPVDGASCRIFFMHQMANDPDGEVSWKAGGLPLLVFRSYGKGRVAVFLGAPIGQPIDREPLPFWEWGGWPEHLGRIINSIMPAEFPP